MPVCGFPSLPRRKTWPRGPGIAAFLLFFASASAFSQIYTWKDENGRTVMSDKPPVGNVQSKRIVNTPPSPPASAPAPKSLAEKEMEMRKEQQARQEKGKKAEEEASRLAERKENCANAQRHLQLYQSGERIARRSDSGEREFVEDDQRAAETAKAQKAVNDWCR